MDKKKNDNEPMLEEDSDEILLEETSGEETLLEESEESEVLLEESSDEVFLEESADSETLLEEVDEKVRKRLEAERKAKEEAIRKAKEAEKDQAKSTYSSSPIGKSEKRQESPSRTDTGNERPEEPENSGFLGTISAILKDEKKRFNYILFGSTGIVFLISFVWGLFVNSDNHWLVNIILSFLGGIPYAASILAIVGAFLSWQNLDLFGKIWSVFIFFVAPALFLCFDYYDEFNEYPTIYARISFKLFFVDIFVLLMCGSYWGPDEDELFPRCLNCLISGGFVILLLINGLNRIGSSEEALKEKYDSLYVAGDDSLRIVSLNGKKGLIDKRGKKKFPLEYDEILEPVKKEVLVTVKEGGKEEQRSEMRTTRLVLLSGKKGLILTSPIQLKLFECEYDSIWYDEYTKKWVGLKGRW